MCSGNLYKISCSILYQSQPAITFITKLVNFGSRGQLPFHCPNFGSASLTESETKQSGVRPIAVGEVIRRLVPMCKAKELTPIMARVIPNCSSTTADSHS